MMIPIYLISPYAIFAVGLTSPSILDSYLHFYVDGQRTTHVICQTY